jgi:hypothetical protein
MRAPTASRRDPIDATPPTRAHWPEVAVRCDGGHDEREPVPQLVPAPLGQGRPFDSRRRIERAALVCGPLISSQWMSSDSLV